MIRKIGQQDYMLINSAQSGKQTRPNGNPNEHQADEQ
jgi:hypothetical protein